MSLIQKICNTININEPINGSWIQAFVFSYDITQSENGTWTQALISKIRETETPPTFQMSFWQEMCFYEGITESINGSWIYTYFITIENLDSLYVVADYVNAGYVL